MKTFREYIQYLFKEEDAPPPDLGAAPPPGGPPAGGPPDMGGGLPPGGPPPDMGGGAAPAGGAPKTKMDVYEVWKDLSDYIKEKFPQLQKFLKYLKNIKITILKHICCLAITICGFQVIGM